VSLLVYTRIAHSRHRCNLYINNDLLELIYAYSLRWSRCLSLTWRHSRYAASAAAARLPHRASKSHHHCPQHQSRLVSCLKPSWRREKCKTKMAAFQTMDAIKRKMHKLKTDKENEYDRVDQLEQKLIELRTRNEKVNYIDTAGVGSLIFLRHFYLPINQRCKKISITLYIPRSVC